MNSSIIFGNNIFISSSSLNTVDTRGCIGLPGNFTENSNTNTLSPVAALLHTISLENFYEIYWVDLKLK